MDRTNLIRGLVSPVVTDPALLQLRAAYELTGFRKAQGEMLQWLVERAEAGASQLSVLEISQAIGEIKLPEAQPPTTVAQATESSRTE